MTRASCIPLLLLLLQLICLGSCRQGCSIVKLRCFSFSRQAELNYIFAVHPTLTHASMCGHRPKQYISHFYFDLMSRTHPAFPAAPTVTPHLEWAQPIKYLPGPTQLDFGDQILPQLQVSVAGHWPMALTAKANCRSPYNIEPKKNLGPYLIAPYDALRPRRNFRAWYCFLSLSLSLSLSVFLWTPEQWMWGIWARAHD
jgi:hypothetical protein